MQRRQVLSAVGVAGLTAIAGCSSEDTDYEEGNGNGNGGGNGGGNGNGSSDPDVSEVVEILEHNLVRENEGEMAESLSVEGRAENTGDEQLSYVEVRVRFYNEAGDMLESSLDNINDFSAGQTWSFEVMYPGMGEDAQEVADYDVGVGTSF